MLLLASHAIREASRRSRARARLIPARIAQMEPFPTRVVQGPTGIVHGAQLENTARLGRRCAMCVAKTHTAWSFPVRARAAPRILIPLQVRHWICVYVVQVTGQIGVEALAGFPVKDAVPGPLLQTSTQACALCALMGLLGTRVWLYHSQRGASSALSVHFPVPLPPLAHRVALDLTAIGVGGLAV
jgi:hypothetical protein